MNVNPVSGFHVLVAFDDTPASWSALQQASDIAAALDGTLTIAHVVQPRVSSFDGASTMLRALEGGLEAGWNLLASATGSVSSASPPRLVVLSGDPVEAIVEYARELEADLIVVGSHRRGGLE